MAAEMVQVHAKKINVIVTFQSRRLSWPSVGFLVMLSML